MSGLEIAFMAVSGIGGFISLLNTFITNRRLRNGLKKSKDESTKMIENMNKLCNALGIQEAEQNDPIAIQDDPYKSQINTPSEIEVQNVRFNKKTGELILPDNYAMRK